MKAAFFVILAGLALAHAARMPELSMVEEDLPESVVAFQGASPLQHVEVEQDDTPLALGEWKTPIQRVCWGKQPRNHSHVWLLRLSLCPAP